MTTTTRAVPRVREPAARPVSQPHDRGEREAGRVAEVVARGGSVAGWSFSTLPASAQRPLQRQEAGKDKSEEEKYKEAAKKAGEAALETDQGKALKERVLADPVVKTVTSPYVLVPAIAGGVAGLAATGKELPIQPPEIPLDRITPGLSAKVTYEGPVDAPTFVGLTLTYKEQGPKGKRASDKDRIGADVARLRAQQQLFKPASEKAAEKKAEDEAVRAWLRSRAGLTIPLTPGPAQKPDAPKKEEERAPVQPAPASAAATMPAHADVEDAMATPGRPLDGATRRSMEACFGYDFSRVRIHDERRANAAADRLHASAFTSGADIVFAHGRYAPSTPRGRRLLAHELTHVAQVEGGGRRTPSGVDAASQHVRPSQARDTEPAFDRSLAGIHDIPVDDSHMAHRVAEEMGAYGFTWRGTIFLGDMFGRPGAPSRDQVLRHERRHVEQTRNGGWPASADAIEAEAHQSTGSSPRLSADPNTVLGWWFVVPIVGGLYVLLRPNVANAPAPGQRTQESVSELQVAAEALTLFAVPAGVGGALARAGYGAIAAYGIAGGTSSVAFRGVQDIGAGEFSGIEAYVVDATTGALIGVVVGGVVRFVGGPSVASPPTTRSLVHLTDEAGHAGITSTGMLRGSQGVYAIPDDAALQSVAIRVLRTGLGPARTTHVVPLTPEAARAFTRPLPFGPVSAYQRLAGVHRAPAGVIDLSTGALTPTTNRLANITGQFWPYGVDAMIWVAAGATGSFLSPATQTAPERGLFSRSGQGPVESRTDGPFVFVEPGSNEADDLVSQVTAQSGRRERPSIIFVAPMAPWGPR